MGFELRPLASFPAFYSTTLHRPLAEVSVSVSAEYSLDPQRYHSEEEVPARHKLVVKDW